MSQNSLFSTYTRRKWSLRACPQENFSRERPLERRKMPFVEQNVGVLIINLYDKMEKLVPSLSFTEI